MSLLDESMEGCCFLEKKHVSDGEGGFINEWTEGEHLNAAITFDTSMAARAAAKQGVRNLYTVTTRKGVALEFHDVIKRISDGKVFRITSDGADRQTPNTARLDMRIVTAEEWIPV